jgi:hypothetical protein
MIYRKLDDNGDYVFGKGKGAFLKDSPEAVAQAVKTRLGLFEGEWFLNIAAGTPYYTQILGKGKMTKYDAAIKAVILGTQGVRFIISYASTVNRDSRKLSINCTLQTIYSTLPITVQV